MFFLIWLNSLQLQITLKIVSYLNVILFTLLYTYFDVKELAQSGSFIKGDEACIPHCLHM